MNPFKVTFVGLGLIYLMIMIYGFSAALPGVPTIGIVGMLWCGLGWSMVNRLLNN